MITFGLNGKVLASYMDSQMSKWSPEPPKFGNFLPILGKFQKLAIFQKNGDFCQKCQKIENFDCWSPINS